MSLNLRSLLYLLFMIGVAVVIGVFALALRPARAHDAPSGWKYPEGCCNDGDCKPIPCDSITETREGYDWKGIHFNENQVRASGDKTCHVCVGKEWIHNSKGLQEGNDKYPHCIFIQPST
jgi:hypothetical protein